MTDRLYAEALETFSRLLDEARDSGMADPNAMAVATADADGVPSVRTVLLKSFDERGFTFYTHLDSHKGRDLRANPRAALLFHWKSLRRQVRIEGPLGEVDPALADAYFASRHPESRLGSAASDQSRPLDSRATYLARVEALRQSHGDDVPRPPHWTGFRLTPERIEFWLDRDHRLHERRLFVRSDEGWNSGLLYP